LPKEQSEECAFINSALIVKSTLLQTAFSAILPIGNGIVHE